MTLPLLGLLLLSELDALLARGELTLIERDASGRLATATAMALIDAPADRVWALLVDFERYPAWMPKVSAVAARPAGEGVVEVDWTLSVAGPDVRYTARHTLDRAAWTVQGRWVSGDLAGSRWDWRLEPRGAQTLVVREVYSNVVGSNWLIQQVEDEEGTLELGINAASGVIELRGLARALAEGR